jgi:hypothetical protein
VTWALPLSGRDAGRYTVPLMPLVFHWGGPRHGEVDEVSAEAVASSALVYDGPRWFGVYQRVEPAKVQDTPAGPAEVWVVRE